MTVIEHTKPTPAPAVRHALRLVRNHAQASPHYFCGYCLANKDDSDMERALDTCLTHMLDMADIIESGTVDPHPSTRISLHVLHELVAQARTLVRLQRRAMPGRV